MKEKKGYDGGRGAVKIIVNFSKDFEQNSSSENYP